MLESAAAQKEVGIVLKVLNDEGNKAQAEIFKKTISEAEKAAIDAAKAGAHQRVQVTKDEQGKRLAVVLKTSKLQAESEKKTTTGIIDESRKRVAIEKTTADQKTTVIEKVSKARKQSDDDAIRGAEKVAEKKKTAAEKEAAAVIAAEKKKAEQVKLAHDQQMEGNRRATESSIGALQGALDLAEGLAILGIASEENFEKFARGFIKVQAAFKAVKGLTELIWKAREALLAMRDAQAAAAAGNVLLSESAVAATGAVAVQNVATGAAGAGGVVAGTGGAGAVAGNIAGEAVGGVAGQAIAGKAAGSAAGNVAGNIVGGAVGGAVASKVGMGTVGGLLKGAGGAIVSGAKGLWGGVKAAGTAAAGVGLGTLAVGGAIAGGLTEGVGYLRSGGGEGGQGYGAGSSLYDEGWIAAIKRYFDAKKGLSESEDRGVQIESQNQQKMEISDRVKSQRAAVYTAARGQRESSSGFETARIQAGDGTEIEKAKQLELKAIREVSEARQRSEEMLKQQHEQQQQGITFDNDLQIAHVEEIRDRESELLNISQNRLNLLKAQNEENKRAVETARSEVKISEKRLETAKATARADQDSKLAAYDRLSAQQKFDVKEIAAKKRRGEDLTEQDARKLEDAGFRVEADRFRAKRARDAGAVEDIRTLGELERSDASVNDAAKEDAAAREKLKQSIDKEKESRDKVTEQSERAAAALERLAATVDRIAVMRSEVEGTGLSSVVTAINQGTDSATQETQLVIDSIKNMKEANAENMKQIREALEARDEIKGAYK